LNKETWKAFRKTVKHYRTLIEKTEASTPDLSKHIQKLIREREGPSYTVEKAVVYNEALNDFTEQSEIKMILVGDNPGRREQEKRRYLVGPSGKIAENFFHNNPALGIDFKKNVLILNKTPIHSPRTTELKTLIALGGRELKAAVLSTQKAMAKLLLKFWEALAASNPIIWIIGYSEMKKGGIFEVYTETLKQLCIDNPDFKENILFFRHFSMNQFAIDLKKRSQSSETAAESLKKIGIMYRERILG
jgi:hypothetical protein